MFLVYFLFFKQSAPGNPKNISIGSAPTSTLSAIQPLFTKHNRNYDIENINFNIKLTITRNRTTIDINMI